MKGIGIAGIGLVLIAISFGMGLERAVDRAEAKNSVPIMVRVNDPADKTVIISSGIGNEAGVRELQNKVNAWLKENHGKVTVKGISPSGDNRWAMVVIWYTPKTD